MRSSQCTSSYSGMSAHTGTYLGIDMSTGMRSGMGSGVAHSTAASGTHHLKCWFDSRMCGQAGLGRPAHASGSCCKHLCRKMQTRPVLRTCFCPLPCRLHDLFQDLQSCRRRNVDASCVCCPRSWGRPRVGLGPSLGTAWCGGRGMSSRDGSRCPP